MARAVILTVDDDPAVSQAVARDLRSRYASDYRIVSAHSGAEAIDVIEELARRDQPVALIVSDHRMPEMTGIEFLERSRPLVPDAKLVLLTAYADTDAAITAINVIGLDNYLMKPWAPPEDRLFPVLDDLLDAWQRVHGQRFAGVRIVGNRWSDTAHDTRLFLARNYVPYQWLELERDPEAQRLQGRLEAAPDELPLVLLPDGAVLRRPTMRDLADALGLRTTAESPLYDLRHRGRGPGRAGGRGLRLVGGAQHRVDRTGGARWAGRSELPHRELPRLPERPERRGPLPPRPHPGPAPGRGDGAHPRRHRARAARLGAGACAWRTAPRSRPVPCWCPRVSTTGSWRPPASVPSPDAGCSTGPRPASPEPPRATTSTSWAPPTPPVRPRSTSPPTPARS